MVSRLEFTSSSPMMMANGTFCICVDRIRLLTVSEASRILIRP